MKNQDLFDLFLCELSCMYDAEKQIVKALPKLVEVASGELKEGLSKHWKETEQQVERLEKIFKLLGHTPQEKRSKTMEAMLAAGEEVLRDKANSPVLEAAIVCACQKVEHFEIAAYGTLYSFAKLLELDGDILDLLKESLKEEGSADKKLTKIAEGSFFSKGVNESALDSNAKCPSCGCNRAECCCHKDEKNKEEKSSCCKK